MSAELRIEVKDNDITAALARLKLGLPLSGSMLKPMQQIARAMLTGTQLRFRSMQGPDGNEWLKSRRASEDGGQTLSLSRRLRNSIVAAATSNSAAVGTDVEYAAIHQFGGVIRAKKGPFLAIPVTPQARSAGGPRDMAGLAVWQTLKGQFVLGDSKTGQVHFLLRRQVTMPARPFLGASNSDKTEIVRVINDHLQGLWKRT